MLKLSPTGDAGHERCPCGSIGGHPGHKHRRHVAGVTICGRYCPCPPSQNSSRTSQKTVDRETLADRTGSHKSALESGDFAAPEPLALRFPVAGWICVRQLPARTFPAGGKHFQVICERPHLLSNTGESIEERRPKRQRTRLRFGLLDWLKLDCGRFPILPCMSMSSRTRFLSQAVQRG